MQEPDEREVLNYAAFMETLSRRAPPASVGDVLGLHRALFAGVLRDAGRVKDRPNFIGRRATREVVFVPTMPERVVPELQAAPRWLHGAPEHRLVKAQVFFHEFQGIHPFRDGNGRAGRALTTWLLHAWGYEGVRYALVDFEFNRDRDGYHDALAAVQRAPGDFTPWLRHMSGVLQRTFEGAVQRFLFRRALPPTLRERQLEVAEWFARRQHDQPADLLRAKFNDAFPAVPARTLQRDLAELRGAGVLTMEGERKGAAYRLAEGYRRARRQRD